MENTAPAEPYRPGRAVLQGLLDLRPSLGLERAEVSVDDAVARGLAVAKVYAFASVDYPGAAQSLVFDSDGTTAVGAFVFDPGNATSPTHRVHFCGRGLPDSHSPELDPKPRYGHQWGWPDRRGVRRLGGRAARLCEQWRHLQQRRLPRRQRTQAIGVNDAGQIVGDYFDAASVEHGFVSSGGTFTAIDFPGATATVAAGINAAGDIVGRWSDATGSHGFLLQAGVFTPINFPLATSTTAFGINDTGEIAGFYTDAAGNSHGFIYAGGAFSTVDVAGARGTQLTRIKNGGAVTGVYTDALNEAHGLTGQ